MELTVNSPLSRERQRERDGRSNSHHISRTCFSLKHHSVSWGIPAVPVSVSSGCSGCGLVELGSVADTQREGEVS